MVKRISCRVIESVPFDKTSAGLLSVRLPNGHPSDFGGATGATVEPRGIIKPARNTDSLSIALGSFEFPTGQILDCYA